MNNQAIGVRLQLARTGHDDAPAEPRCDAASARQFDAAMAQRVAGHETWADEQAVPQPADRSAPAMPPAWPASMQEPAAGLSGAGAATLLLQAAGPLPQGRDGALPAAASEPAALLPADSSDSAATPAHGATPRPLPPGSRHGARAHKGHAGGHSQEQEPAAPAPLQAASVAVPAASGAFGVLAEAPRWSAPPATAPGLPAQLSERAGAMIARMQLVHGPRPGVQVAVRESVLPGVTVQIAHQQGQWQVDFHVSAPASLSLLQGAGPRMATELSTRLGCGVQVRVAAARERERGRDKGDRQ